MKKSETTIKKIKRRRILMTAGAVVLSAVVIGDVILFWNITRAADDTIATTESATVTESSSSSGMTTAYVNPAPTLVSRDTSESTAEEESESSSTTTTTTTASTTTTSATTSTKSTTTSTTTASATESTKKTTQTTETSSSSGYLKSIDDLPAGKVISSDKIDKSNLGKYFTSHEIKKGDAVYKRIYGKSYKTNNDIALSDLRYLKMLHVNFNGKYQVGEMIVNKKVASEVMGIFKTLCKEKYQIYSMYLIDNFWTGDGDSSDYASIDANNTSAFCYRKATGSSKLSKHGLGLAIDINPQQNPYVTYKNGKPKYSHSNAAKYVENRSSDTPHVITKSDLAYKLFTSKGWSWGGSWSTPKDYQHFQKK